METKLGKAPLVSVMINTHNGAKYLREAIMSVYAQTIEDFEIILYDNASTDETPALVKEFDGRLKYHRSEDFLLLGAARNRALEKAEGRFICFLDSDDLFLPQKLENQVAAFGPGVGLVYSNTIMMTEKLGKEEVYFKHKLPSGMIFGDLIAYYCLSIVTVMISREAMGSDPSGWFPEDFTYAEEADFFTRICHRYEARYIDEPLSKFRIHGGNFTLKHPEIVVKEKEAMIRRLADLVPGFDEKYEKEIRSYHGWLSKNKAILAWRDGKRLGAFYHYLDSFRSLGRPTLLLEGLASLSINYGTMEKLRGWR